ncbi:Histidine ammonia-lyase [Vreelandella boliviensis LC1]|uniref:Histidine ammonia-lyase n=1 Tax=Vreelandella boliviensis LC1 TaxID=1072583 RepID=A0A7U9BXU0_9GAMM|nr:Histidine ammonia-lyase [Halomonas boliviensis LC1]
MLAIELLAAAQGVEFHRPMTTSPLLEVALATIRRDVTRYERDRYFAPDLVAAQRFVSGAAFETQLPRSRLYTEE